MHESMCLNYIGLNGWSIRTKGQTSVFVHSGLVQAWQVVWMQHRLAEAGGAVRGDEEPCLWVTTASLENKAGGDLVWEACLCSAAMQVWGQGLGNGCPVKTEALRRKAGDGGQSLWGHQRPETAVAVRSVPRVRDRSQIEVSTENGRRPSCEENWGERAGTLRSPF